ncbi:phosphotransferase family protein [Chloroflexota bacterium]
MEYINSYNITESQVKSVIQRHYPKWGAIAVNQLPRHPRSILFEVSCLNASPRVVKLYKNKTQEEVLKELSEYQIIYKELRKGGVPVSEVLHISQDSKELSVPYCVMTKLEGKQAKEVLNTKMGQSEFDEIIGKMGEVLFRIHQVESQRVGAFSRNISDSNIDWWKYLDSLLNSYQQNMTESIQCQQTIQYLRNKLPQLNGLGRITLVHNDFDFHNILVKQTSGHWEVSGILDFEWSFYGDGDWDIAWFYWSLRESYDNYYYLFNVFKSTYYNSNSSPVPSLDKIKAYILFRLLFLQTINPSFSMINYSKEVMGW